MRTVCWVAVTVSTVLLCGCANLKTIRAFAKDGSTVAAAAQKDVEIFASSCADLRAELAVLAYAHGSESANAKPLETCTNVLSSAQITVESLSVRLLIKYHEALNALAGDENWTVAKEIEALGSEVKKVQADGTALASAADVDKYQAAFSAIAAQVTSALRERQARRLLREDLNWKEVLAPLRFWYGGADGKSVSFYSQACHIVKTDWVIVQSQLMEYARCGMRKARGAPVCEPLVAGIRLASIDSKIKPVAACAPGSAGEFPQAAAARVALIDSWLAAHEELRKKVFEKDVQGVQEKLAVLRTQIDAVKQAFQ